MTLVVEYSVEASKAEARFGGKHAFQTSAPRSQARHPEVESEKPDETLGRDAQKPVQGKRLNAVGSKVFGIGWAKTGTTTLGVCLAKLGYNHQSQDREAMYWFRDGEVAAIVERARHHDSFEDWPWLLLYRELDAAFPGSKFILTTRDTADWLRSYRGMIGREAPADEELNSLRSALYGLDFPHVTDEALCDRFERHSRDVIRYFAGRRSDLLVVDWSDGDGWRELCAFLGKDTPKEAFPHANAAPA